MADPAQDGGSPPGQGAAQGAELSGAHIDWMAQFTGISPAVLGGAGDAAPGAGQPAQLQLGLTADEAAACGQYLDAHFGIALRQGGTPSKMDDYLPTLDGKPVTVRDVVDALLPTTTAGFSVKNGGAASGPLYEGAVAQLTKLVQDRHLKLALPKATAGAASIYAAPKSGSADGTPMVAKSAVQAAVTDFLKQVMAQQKGRSVRITEPVKLAVFALTRGLPGLMAGGSLPGDDFGHDPAQLAAQICKPLPDPFPAANLAEFQAASPKEFAAPNLSASDVLAKLVSKPVNAAISVLPKEWQDKVRDAVAGAIASGISAGVGKALEGAPLDDATKKAIESAVEAALKQKEGGTPPDPAAGSPDAPVQPPSSAPPFDESDDVVKSPEIPF